MRRFLITGGAGFIGSNFVRYLLRRRDEASVTVLDKLTYAGNLDNLREVEADPRYRFVHGDICDRGTVLPLVREADVVVNFAAETHVDRSLLESGSFVMTDVFGVYVLLEASRECGVQRFLQISTDEVYGSVEQGYSTETDALCPRNPYCATKAGAEMLAHSYFISHELPVLITRASNNFGPYQHPEKMMPLFITNALDDEPLPIYGDGLQVRDWLFVEDHCVALDLLLERGQPGETYNIGGDNERRNLEVTESILRLLGKPMGLVRYVTDRPGHDRRYALDSSKTKALGWQRAHTFEAALEETVRWYVDNEWWWRKVKSGEFKEYYAKQYGDR